MTAPMRIGIDVRYLSHGLLGGVHTYETYFVPALISLAENQQIYLYADTKQPFELSNLPPNVTVRYLPWKNGLSSIQNDWFMREKMAQDRLDVVHFPANYGFGPKNARTIITLHDEINILPWLKIMIGHPKKARTLAMMTYLHICSLAALRQAAVVLTVSDYARRQIAHYGRLNPEKIIPIPHAPAPDLRKIESTIVLNEVRTRLGIRRPFILADAIKNPGVILQAWKQLAPELRTDRQILFFSRRPDPPQEVFQAVAEGAAQLLVRPGRADLIALYNMAEVFVFPSKIEGFGLPLLEAMTCGAPVIASNRGSIPEVAGNAALLIDAEDSQSLAGYLTLLLTSPTEAGRLRELGFVRAAQFSWSRTARCILDGYQMALAA
jgi:glycosyltransferase involved in cell wall biosynthesis